MPSFLPDGRHFMFVRGSAVSENNGLYIGSLAAKPEDQSSKRLTAISTAPLYVPGGDSALGELLFLREGVLLSQTFDDKRLELVGEPVPVVEQVGGTAFFGSFSASTNGVLVYMSGVSQISHLTWFSRQGQTLGAVGEPGTYHGLELSPDGTRAAVGLESVSQPGFWDIWLLDFVRGTNLRFTFGGTSSQPIWAPDGSRIIFTSGRHGIYDLYQKQAGGVKDEELLLKSSESKDPTSWSSDGRFLLYTSASPKTKADLWVLPLEGDRKPVPFLCTEFNEIDGHFSPDNRWVAYTSDESGSNEIYVRGFSQTSAALSDAGGKWLISKGGGTGARWRADGKELYYRAPDGKAMAVEVTANRVFQAGSPKVLFHATPEILTPHMTGQLCNWNVTPDGKRFLLSTPAMESTQTPFTVVLNWTALLRK
jgi:hypothetical protein